MVVGVCKNKLENYRILDEFYVQNVSLMSFIVQSFMYKVLVVKEKNKQKTKKIKSIKKRLKKRRNQ